MVCVKLEGLGVVCVIGDVEFQIQILVEVQELVVFFVGIFFKFCQMVVGLFCIFVSVIEYGNFEFMAEEKVQGLVEGKWNQKLVKCMGECLYEGCMVKVCYQCG